MSTQSFLTVCTKNKRLSTAAFEVRLRLPDHHSFTFEPGQFVLLDVPLTDNPADIQTRAYSIASAPEENHELLFCIMNKAGGRATKWIQAVLKPGDTVRLQGPMGRFVIDRATSKNYLFLATGTGIAPFHAMVRDLLEQHKERRTINLLFGYRHENDLFWTEVFRLFEERFPNFHFHLCLSDPSSSWKGFRGFVQHALPSIIKDFSRVQAYLCGGPAMIADVRRFLEERGVPKEDVKYEGYV